MTYVPNGRQCDGKQKMDRESAEVVAAKMRLYGSKNCKADDRYHAYQCGLCDAYHVGRGCGVELSPKLITCRDCRVTFEFHIGEQIFFNKQGFPDPRRCAGCRAKRRAT